MATPREFAELAKELALPNSFNIHLRILANELIRERKEHVKTQRRLTSVLKDAQDMAETLTNM